MSRVLVRRLVAVLLLAGLFTSASPRLAGGIVMADQSCEKQRHSCEKDVAILQCCCGHDVNDAQPPAQTESRTQLQAPSASPVLESGAVPAIAVPLLLRAVDVEVRARSAPDRLALLSIFLI